MEWHFAFYRRASTLNGRFVRATAESRRNPTGPPPAKLRPFSLWPIMAEENENGLFEI